MLNLTGVGLLVFTVLAATALFSLWLSPHLPEHYRSAGTTSNLRLGMGVIATIAAVVLGLLINGVKGHFDLTDREVQALGADLIVLDRTLRFYGPDASRARDLVARYTERVLEGTFPSNRQAPIVDDQLAEDLLNQTEQAILSQMLLVLANIVEAGPFQNVYCLEHRDHAWIVRRARLVTRGCIGVWALLPLPKVTSALRPTILLRRSFATLGPEPERPEGVVGSEPARPVSNNVLTPPAPKKNDLLARLAIGFLVASGGG